MKLIWKGKFKSFDDLPKNELPENAVKFKEPSLLLGWLPFFIGLVFFPTLPFGKFIMAAGFYGALMGSGDCINIFNTAVQMPKGSLTKPSGMNSYWYFPDDKLQ